MAHLAELLPPLTDAARRHIETGLEQALARIVTVLGATPHHTGYPALARIPRWHEVGRWPADERRRAALALHQATAADYFHTGGVDRVLRGLDGPDLPWTQSDLIWSLHTAQFRYEDEPGTFLELPGLIAGRLDPTELTDLVPALSALFAEVIDPFFLGYGTRRRVTELIGRAIDRAEGATVPSWHLHDGDGFGPAVRARLSDLLAAPGVPDLLAHCAALDQPAAPVTWLRRLDAHLAATPDARTFVRAVLTAFAAHDWWVHDDTDRLLRGLAWALSRDGDEPATDLLARVTAAAATAPPNLSGFPCAERTATAMVPLLAERAGEAPARTLARLALTVRNKALQRRVQSALAQVASVRGWSLDEVMELAVDSHGLGADGRRGEQVGAYEATVAVVADKARLTFSRAGTALRSIPATVKEEHSGQLRQLRDLVKGINRTLAVERQRIEGLLSEGRVWAYPDWISRYLEHPISGGYGRRLLWEASADGRRWSAGLPRPGTDGWTLAGLDGRAVPGRQVRLWHPIRAGAVEVAAWRQHMLDTGVRQPFKQAFREVYRCTPAEEQTRAYSNRFAGHILRYRQANALMRIRGWQAGYLGTWDHGDHGEATAVVGGGRWRASFFHDRLANADDREAGVLLCATDQVRFARREGEIWQPTPVVDVPPLVFTEVMRDVDLFVGVTSIAADPQWADRGEDRFRTYWQGAVFGELSQSGEVRRDALARLLSRMRIANRTELSDRFLRVRGNIRAYRIHLGSGNILMEPNDEYLCIVAARTRTGGLHLPFEDDPMLSTILSKALLLAADDKITDPTIRRQLGG